MTGFLKTRVAAATVLLLCGVDGVAAGPMPVPAIAPIGGSSVVAVQYYGGGYPLYGYRRPYGYRPYGYRPYGYGPGPRFYRPGAAKERYNRRRNFCNHQPERC